MSRWPPDILVCEVTTPFPMIVLQHEYSTAGVEARVYKARNLGIVQLVDNLNYKDIEKNEKLPVARN